MGENRITDDRFRDPPAWPHGVSTAEFYASLPTAQPASSMDLYAVAWTLAQRDYELNLLFNPPPDFQI